MGMIFPGMDPYLEDPLLYPGFHNTFMVYLSDHLQPLLRPRYVASVEERVYIEGSDREIIPDVNLKRTMAEGAATAVALADAEVEILVETHALEIHEIYLTILDLKSGQRIVTVVEMLSPTNKYAGPGQVSYLSKQHEVLRSTANLVEIDLLRRGPHVLAVPEKIVRSKADYEYLISVNRAGEKRNQFLVYPTRLRKRLPQIRIPLSKGEPDVRADLQAVLARVYESGSYEYRINYQASCVPPLPPDDQEWANQLIRQAPPPS